MKNRSLICMIAESLMFLLWYIGYMITLIIPSIVLPEITGILELSLFPPLLCKIILVTSIILFFALIFISNDSTEHAKSLIKIWRISTKGVLVLLLITAILTTWAMLKEGFVIAIFYVFIPLYYAAFITMAGTFRFCQYNVASIENWDTMTEKELITAILAKHPKAEKHLYTELLEMDEIE